MEVANQHDGERMVSDLENLTKISRCFPTSNGCFSSQGNCVHDLNSFQGKSVKNHKQFYIYSYIQDKSGYGNKTCKYMYTNQEEKATILFK